MRSISCFCKNRETTSGPNVKDTPRSFSLQPVMSLSGSDHSRSQSNPQSGIYSTRQSIPLIEMINEKPTSVGRITRLICSILFKSGDRPPCMVKIFSSIMAAMGRQLKQSVNVFHNFILYLLLHSS